MDQRNTPPLGGMSTPPPGRKRPRTDKPPSNLYGEKRRREQESSYMEELVELIKASISNPESKTDKLAPLLEKWNQMKNRMKEQQPEEQQHGSEVQHSQVSSSKPGMLSGDSLESVLLQTLDGFLFVVNMSNNKAEIEYASGNIQSFLNYKQEDLIGQSIYNFIHVNDHSGSISCLVPNSSNAGGMWKDHGGKGPSMSRSFNCRMKVKYEDPSGMSQETRYQNMKCSAMLKPATDKDGESSSSAEGEGTSHLYIVAQRATDEGPSSGMGSGTMAPAMMTPAIEEMTLEMDMNCCITGMDMSKVKPPYHSKEEMVSQPIYKYCHSADRTDMRKYFDEVKEKGSANSSLYSFQLFLDLWVYIQMNSHIRKNQHTGQTEIVAVHSIIRDTELSNRLKSTANTSGQGAPNTTSRVLEALSNMKPGGLNSSTVNQLTLIMMKRQQAQAAQAQKQQQQLQQQQQQQQHQQGMGYGANSMNNVHPGMMGAAGHQGGGSGMVGGTVAAPPPSFPDRTNSYPGSLVGGYPQGSVANPLHGMSSMNNVVNSAGGGSSGGVAVPPNLEQPSMLSSQIPSSSGGSGSGHARGMPPFGEVEDSDSVFLPGMKSASAGPGKTNSGGEQRQPSTDNPSPDTNETETDKEFLRKNFLLSKLLEDDDTNIDKIEAEVNNKVSPPTSSASSSLLGGHPKGGVSGGGGQVAPHRKDILDNNLLKTMLEEESLRQHQASDANAKKQEQQDRARATSKSTLLAGMLDGDATKMFGSGKLPREQPGFISSTIVSTTTALRKVSESEEGISGSGGRGNGAGGSSKEQGASKRPKKRNELLEKLLREEDECSSSDQNNGQKKHGKADGSPNKDATTSPTVTSTKPQLPRPDGMSNPLLDDDTGLIDDENVIQQIIRAADTLPHDLGANNPNLIMDLLNDFDNNIGPDFVKQYLSTDPQMNNQRQQGGGGGGGGGGGETPPPPPPPNYSGPTGGVPHQHQQMYPNMSNQGGHPPYPGDPNMGGFGGPMAAPTPVDNMPGGSGAFAGFPGDPMMQGGTPGGQPMNKATPPQQQQQQSFGPSSVGGRMFPQQAKNRPNSQTPDKMKEKTAGVVNLPGGEEDIIQQLEQVLNSPQLDMNMPPSSTQDNFLWGNKPNPRQTPTTPQNMPAQSSMAGSFTPGTPVSSSTAPQPHPAMGTAMGGGVPHQVPQMIDRSMSMPGTGAGGGMGSTGIVPQPTRFQSPVPRPGYASNMGGPGGHMQPQQQQSMMHPQQPMQPTPGVAHPSETPLARQPNPVKQALMMKKQWRQEQEQRNLQQQRQQQQHQQQMMQQQQMRIQQQKNLMMLQQKQQQQTFSGPQMEGQMFSGMDQQAYGQTKLTEMLNPSSSMAAPNVSIQKANMPFGNQMGQMGHPMQPGASMGPRPMHHGMSQYPQGNPAARPSPDYGPQFGQMMPQSRGMPAGYQSTQHGMVMGGYPGPADFGGGMGPSGGMGPGPGNMGGMSPSLSGMMHGGMAGQMGGSQHPGMSMSPGMAAGNPMSPVAAGMRSGMRPGSMGPRMGAPQLNRSMSMPQSTMNMYQMPGNPPQGSYGSFGGPGGNPAASSMAMRQPGMAAAMSRQASMPETMNGNMRWNSGGANPGGMQAPYGGGGATPASSMAANQFGAPTAGAMDFQNMMQQRGVPMQGQQMGHAGMGSMSNTGGMNPGMQQPPNQQGGFPGGQGNPQHSASTTNNTSGSFPPSTGPGGPMQGGSTELEKMMNFGNMMGDFNKPGGMMGSSGGPSMPPQSNAPDSNGNARRNQMKMAQNQAHKQARSRYQEFCKVSNAKEAPDAKTRATNLFKNQLLGMAPNLSQNAGNIPTPTLLPTSAGSNQQRMAQERRDQNSGDGQDDGNKHSLLQKLLSST